MAYKLHKYSFQEKKTVFRVLLFLYRCGFWLFHMPSLVIKIQLKDSRPLCPELPCRFTVFR